MLGRENAARHPARGCAFAPRVPVIHSFHDKELGLDVRPGVLGEYAPPLTARIALDARVVDAGGAVPHGERTHELIVDYRRAGDAWVVQKEARVSQGPVLDACRQLCGYKIGVEVDCQPTGATTSEDHLGRLVQTLPTHRGTGALSMQHDRRHQG